MVNSTRAGFKMDMYYDDFDHDYENDDDDDDGKYCDMSDDLACCVSGCSECYWGSGYDDDDDDDDDTNYDDDIRLVHFGTIAESRARAAATAAAAAERVRVARKEYKKLCRAARVRRHYSIILMAEDVPQHQANYAYEMETFNRRLLKRAYNDKGAKYYDHVFNIAYPERFKDKYEDMRWLRALRASRFAGSVFNDHVEIPF